MSLYIIYEKSNDRKWRFYDDDGELISDISWERKPNKMDLVDALDKEQNGSSIFDNSNARRKYTQIVTNNIVYRGNDKNLPWEDAAEE